MDLIQALVAPHWDRKESSPLPSPPFETDLQSVLTLHSDPLELSPERAAEGERLRAQLASGAGRDRTGALLTDIWSYGSLLTSDLQWAAGQPSAHSHHLYVLEFQGAEQMVKFGRATDIGRRVRDLRKAAEMFGFALLNGWVSPAAPDVTWAEQMCKVGVYMLRGHILSRECVYGMPFVQARDLGRAAFELHTDWSPPKIT